MRTKQTELKLEKEKHPALAKTKRILLPHLSVQLSDINSPNRTDVERYISSQFYNNHQAKINNFLPYILSAQTSKKITSTIGFRLAKPEQDLFLEQYLDKTADIILGQHLIQKIDRKKIAEIGNLTSSYPGSSQMLFVLIISILHQAGLQWALFTATDQVRKMIESLGISCLDICDADSERLTDSHHSWGNYYKKKPKVIAGNLSAAYEKLKKHDVAGFMINNYQKIIHQIAQRIDI